LTWERPFLKIFGIDPRGNRADLSGAMSAR
jgi:hypothetical protein